jgi:hypothetical protein
MEHSTRVYRLAHQLEAEPAQILALCRKAGIEAKNLLSSLTPTECKIVLRLLGGQGPDGGAGKPSPVRHPPSAGQGSAAVQNLPSEVKQCS